MGSDIVGAPSVYGDNKLCARIDLKSASAVDDVGLDDVVTVTVRGKVRALRGRDEYKTLDYPSTEGKGKPKEVTRTNPGSIELEVMDMKVNREGEFDGMVEE